MAEPKTVNSQALITWTVESSTDNPSVQRAMNLIARAKTQRRSDGVDNNWRAITRMLKEGFEIYNPSGSKVYTSQLILQAVRRVVSKQALPDIQIHGTGVSENNERIVTEGVRTVLKRGGLSRALRSKRGAFYEMNLLGDTFIHVFTDPNKKYPLRFKKRSLMNVFIDTQAIEMRNEAGERDVEELCIVEKYTIEKALTIPGFKKHKAGSGRIFTADDFRPLDETMGQRIFGEGEAEAGFVQIGYYYNKVTKTFITFAGAGHTIINEQSGDDYKWVMDDGTTYIPVYHLFGIPSFEGFYNYGIGHIVYRLGKLTERLNNKAIRQGIDNIDPIRMVNIPASRKASFWKQLGDAERLREQDGRGVIVNHFDPLSPNANRVSIDSFSSEPITQEWERLFNFLDTELKRLGINLDDIGRDKVLTATQVIAEEESANAFAGQTIEDNAHEFTFMWESSMDIIQKKIGHRNKTLVDLTTKIVLEGKQVSMNRLPRERQFTLGKLSEELKVNHYFVKGTLKSTTVKSDAVKRSQVMSSLQFAEPGTSKFEILSKTLDRLNGIDIPDGISQNVEQTAQGANNAQAPKLGATTFGQPANDKIGLQ